MGRQLAARFVFHRPSSLEKEHKFEVRSASREALNDFERQEFGFIEYHFGAGSLRSGPRRHERPDRSENVQDHAWRDCELRIMFRSLLHQFSIGKCK